MAVILPGVPLMALGAAVADCPKRPLEIPDQVAHLSMGLDYLERACEELASRLIPVVRPPAPTIRAEGQGKPINPPPATPIGDRISELTARVKSMEVGLLEILDRLEV